MAWNEFTPEQIKEMGAYQKEESKQKSIEKLKKMEGMSLKEEFMFTVENTIEEHWTLFRLPLPMAGFSSRFSRSAKRHFGSWDRFMHHLDLEVGIMVLICPPRSKRFLLTRKDADAAGIVVDGPNYENYIEMLGSNKKQSETMTDLEHDSIIIGSDTKESTIDDFVLPGKNN